MSSSDEVLNNPAPNGLAPVLAHLISSFDSLYSQEVLAGSSSGNLANHMDAVARKKQFLITYLLTGNVSEACNTANITRNTLHNNWAKDKVFIALRNEIEEMKLDVAEAKLFNHIADGNLKAVMYYLDRKGKKRGWGNEVKQVHELTNLEERMLRARSRKIEEMKSANPPEPVGVNMQIIGRTEYGYKPEDDVGDAEELLEEAGRTGLR